MPTTPTLTLAVHAKDEAEGLLRLVAQARPHVDRVLIIADPTSEDATVAVARGIADKVIELCFPPGGFGELANRCVFECETDWSLRLDCDETLTGWPELRSAISAGLERSVVWAIRRRRWADRQMMQQIDSADPDWNTRLAPVTTEPIGHFTRLVHVDFSGATRRLGERGIWIDHFHDLRSDSHRQRRAAQNIVLAAQEGLAVEGGQYLDTLCVCGQARSAHRGAREYAVPPFGSYDGRCLGFRSKG